MVGGRVGCRPRYVPLCCSAVGSLAAAFSSGGDRNVQHPRLGRLPFSAQRVGVKLLARAEDAVCGRLLGLALRITSDRLSAQPLISAIPCAAPFHLLVTLQRSALLHYLLRCLLPPRAPAPVTIRVLQDGEGRYCRCLWLTTGGSAWCHARVSVGPGRMPGLWFRAAKRRGFRLSAPAAGCRVRRGPCLAHSSSPLRLFPLPDAAFSFSCLAALRLPAACLARRRATSYLPAGATHHG